MRQGVGGVDLDGAVVVFERLREGLLGEDVPVEAAAQVSLVGGGAVGAALLKLAALVAGETRDERLGHEFGDGVFELEHVGRALVEASGPARGALAHVEQLGGDADAVA